MRKLPSISSTLNVRIFHTKVISAATFVLEVSRKKLPKRRFVRKTRTKMLMKLTQGHNMPTLEVAFGVVVKVAIK